MRLQTLVIMDKSNMTKKYSSAYFVALAGITTLNDAKYALAHNKEMDIDGGTVITGSFNFTKATEKSTADNLLVTRNKTLAGK